MPVFDPWLKGRLRHDAAVTQQPQRAAARRRIRERVQRSDQHHQKEARGGDVGKSAHPQCFIHPLFYLHADRPHPVNAGAKNCRAARGGAGKAPIEKPLFARSVPHGFDPDVSFNSAGA